MAMHARASWRVVAALGLLGACSGEALAPEGWRQPGILLLSGWTGNTPMYGGNGGDLSWNRPVEQTDFAAPDILIAPDSVSAGVAFEVTTRTVGPSGCWRADGQSVTTFGRTVVLKPYDSHSGSEVCTGALVFPAHSSTVVLYEPGEWRLRVDGRRLRLGEEEWEEPISAERSIIVR